MPFDVLPHHNIRFPEFRPWIPPWQMYESSIIARQNMYNMMLRGLDSVLNAVDPAQRAARQVAMMQPQLTQLRLESAQREAEFEQQYGIPLKEAQANAQQSLYNWQKGQYDLMNRLHQRATGETTGTPNALPSPGTPMNYQGAYPQDATAVGAGLPGTVEPSSAPLVMAPPDEDQNVATTNDSSGGT